MEDLRRDLALALEQFGIPCFSLVAMLPSGANGARAPQTLLTKTVNGWAEHYWREQAFNFDPTVHAALRRYDAFSWSDIETTGRLTKPAQHLFAAIRDVMPVDGGLVIPIHDERGWAGLIGLYQEDRQLPQEVISAVKLIAIYALERAKALSPAATAPPPSSCPLTPRQRELLAFAASGKSDWDIAQLLGISAKTANEHLEKAKQALGVRTRAQAVALAVRCGWIVL